MQESGGTANGGQDTSTAQIFLITVKFFNQAPTLTASNPAAVNENSGAQTVSSWATFTPGLPGETVKAYTVTNVSNPSLFSATPAVDTSGNLTYTPAAMTSGTSTFAVKVQETGGTANGGKDTSVLQTFTITVNFVNQPPTFTVASGNPPSANENSGAQTVLSWAALPPDCRAMIPSRAIKQYNISNVSNPSLFSSLPAVANNGTLTYTPATNTFGTSTFTVNVQDTGGTANGGQDTSAPQTFTITVNFLNKAPTFAATNPPVVSQLSGPVTVPNWATFTPGLQGETVLAYHVGNLSNPSLFSALPAVDNNGNLTYTPAGTVGTSTFTVNVQETGGTANGGQDTSSNQTFTISIAFVNQPPTFSAANPPSTNENSGALPRWPTGRPSPLAFRAKHSWPTTSPMSVRRPCSVPARPWDNSGKLTYTLAANMSRHFHVYGHCARIRRHGQRRPRYLDAADIHHHGEFRQPTAHLQRVQSAGCQRKQRPRLRAELGDL